MPVKSESDESKALRSTRADGKGLVVTLHGVGAAKPGSTLAGLTKFFSDRTGATYSSSSRILKGVPYTWSESSDVQAPNLMEVNWSDIRRAPTSWYSETLQIPKLLLGMLHLADRWHGGLQPTRWLLSVYRIFVETTVWGVPYIVYVMLLGSMHTPGHVIAAAKPIISGGIARLIFALASSAALIFVGKILWRWSRIIAVSAVGWSFVYLITGLACALRDASWTWFAEVASKTYVTRHVMFPIVVLLVFAFCVASSRELLNLEQRLARFLLAYLPFLAISVVGSLLWIGAIPVTLKLDNFFANSGGYEHWSSLHASILVQRKYDLQLAEFMNLAAISVFGIAILATAVLYKVRISTGWQLDRSGLDCRNALSSVSWLVPIGATALLAVIFRSHWRPNTVEPRDVLAVYKVSALRVVPFLPWIFSPMRIVLDVIGDVLFAALPADDLLSIRREVLDRAQTGIDYAIATGARKIILFSHSLGTIFAAACVGSARATVELITSGSPITTLHARFLGFKLEMVEGFQGAPNIWANYYRFGDYIGGPIREEGSAKSVRNICQEHGGHTGYWCDPEILTALAKEFQSINATGASG